VLFFISVFYQNMDEPLQHPDIHPLTTEEPIHATVEPYHGTLAQAMSHLNKVDLTSPLVSPAIIEEKPDPNMLLLSSEDEHTPTDEKEAFLSSSASSSEEEEYDPEKEELLWQTTEANKHIPYTQDMNTSSSKGNRNNSSPATITITDENNNSTTTTGKPKRALRRASTTKRKSDRGHELLVFSEPATLVQKVDRYILTTMYGAGPNGTMSLYDDDDAPPQRRSRAYMVACDFSDESFYAMEWVMGTMMRDGDVLHIVAAVNREDNPDAVKKAGLSLKSEVSFLRSIYCS
jgi:hypothetical protein